MHFKSENISSLLEILTETLKRRRQESHIAKAFAAYTFGTVVCLSTQNLKYYFNIKVSLSFRASVRLCARRLTPIPAGESQDVTNKSCSICLRG